MRYFSLFCAAAAAAVFVSCGPSSETEVSGQLSGDVPEHVYVYMESRYLRVPVRDSAFTVTMPTDRNFISYAIAGEKEVKFIADGYDVNIDFSADRPLAVSKKKRGLTSRLTEAMVFHQGYEDEFTEGMQALQESGASFMETASFADSCRSVLWDYFRKLLEDNLDNAVSLYAVNHIDNAYHPDELLRILDGMSEPIRNTATIKRLKAVTKAQSATAEGRMFKDFSVKEESGAEVKLSDYVGRGKYVLVNFWGYGNELYKAEIPAIKSAYERFGGDGFDVLSVAVVSRIEDVAVTSEDIGMNWNHIRNADYSVLEIYGHAGLPLTILFGPDGTILERNLHPYNIEAAVARYMEN